MSFKIIKGQDRAINILKTQMLNKRIPCGYLFSGAEGIGKFLTARTFAKAINCIKQMPDSCDDCPSCLKIDKGGHPDVHIVDLPDDTPESDTIKIEQIRQINKEVGLKPYEGRKKVFIINDAHRLTIDAQNAVLKTLEEPPIDTLIILVSSKPDLLFKTIISRCQIIKFSTLKRKELKDIIKRDYGLSDTVAHFLAYFCEGRIGAALKLIDTDIFRQKNIIIDSFILTASGRQRNQLDLSKKSMRSYLDILASYFRDIYLIKAGIPLPEAINLDRRDELFRLSGRYSFADLNEIMNIIKDTSIYLEQNLNAKLLFSYLEHSLKN